MALVRIQNDLFADAGSAASDEFRASFEAWLSARRGERRLAASSAAVYEDMWNAFARWCQQRSRPISIGGLTASDLAGFLDSRTGAESGGDLSARYVWRMLSLIDRVLEHRAGLLHEPKNGAAAEMIERDAAIRQANVLTPPPPEYLPADEARRLVLYLSRPPRSDRHASPARWQALRNRAAVALQLGCGLTPGEVRGLHCDAVIVEGGPLVGVPWKIRVREEAIRAARETPVAQWAGKVLRDWIALRESVRFPADSSSGASVQWLFPSTLKHGTQWPKVAHWEAVNKVLSDAGLAAPTGGSFRLRHTFALRQLRRGKSAYEVAQWMGIVDVIEMERYRNILADQDVI